MHSKHWKVPSLSPFKGFLHLSITSLIVYVYVNLYYLYMCKPMRQNKNHHNLITQQLLY